jgi:hypothetical protein
MSVSPAWKQCQNIISLTVHWINASGFAYYRKPLFQVYVLKRPYVDEFLCKVGQLFECVLFTASLAKVSSKSSGDDFSYIFPAENSTEYFSLKKLGNFFWKIVFPRNSEENSVESFFSAEKRCEKSTLGLNFSSLEWFSAEFSTEN